LQQAIFEAREVHDFPAEADLPAGEHGNDDIVGGRRAAGQAGRPFPRVTGYPNELELWI
jgi:hypothetical protein